MEVERLVLETLLQPLRRRVTMAVQGLMLNLVVEVEQVQLVFLRWQIQVMVQVALELPHQSQVLLYREVAVEAERVLAVEPEALAVAVQEVLRLEQPEL